MRFTVLICGLMLSATVFAQNSTPTSPKRISHYMQETGLLYLETTKQFIASGRENEYPSPMTDPDDKSDVNHYGEVLQVMEDHIQINITSATDKQFFRLLQRTKAAAELFIFGDPSMMYAACYTAAHQAAIQGTLSIGNCTEKKFKETAGLVSDARLQEAKAELEKLKQDQADLESGVVHLTPAQKELCAKDATFNFCAGTPEAKAKADADKKAKTEEMCAKGVFDKDYCAKFEASQAASPK
jgi:hypothetical protein